MTILTYGAKTAFDTQVDAATGIAAHLERFERAGWGYDIRLETSRGEAVSSGSAMCWVTWRIEPKNGIQSWQWENVYGYRMGLDGKEGWERGMVVGDNEVDEVMQRAPQIFASWRVRLLGKR